MQIQQSPLTLAAGAAVGQHRRVVLNSSGQAVHAGVGEVGLGTFSWDGRPSNGLDSTSTKTLPVCASGSLGAFTFFQDAGKFYMVASGAISKGAVIYAAAAGKVSATGFVPIGIADSAATADGDVIEAFVIPRVDFPLYGNSAVSANVENTTTATKFSLNPTLPAGLFRNGDHVEIEYSGLVVGVTGTPTLAIRLLIGPTGSPLVLAAVAAATVAANGVFVGRASGVVRANAGTSSLNGLFQGCTGAAGANVGGRVFNVALDPAVANDVAVEATWSAADAANIARLDMLRVNLRRS